MKVLITGATNGIGKGVARALAKHPNVELLLLGRSAPLLAQTRDELAAPGRVETLCCDLARMSEVRRACRELREQRPRLDAVFINAGIGYAKHHELTEDGLDAHFQVNYLSQFMLTLHLLELLEHSQLGGRVIFNTPSFGDLHWDDLQLKTGWSYERAIGQAMVARRMFYTQLHQLYAARPSVAVSCFGFEIAQTVWTNQVNLIPAPMRLMATLMKALGQFISIDACGEIMAPLFLESRDDSARKSGRLLTWKEGQWHDREKHPAVLEAAQRERLWHHSLELCRDEATTRAAARLSQP